MQITIGAISHKNPMKKKILGLKTKKRVKTETSKKNFLEVNSQTLIELGKTVSSHDSHNNRYPHSSTVV